MNFENIDIGDGDNEVKRTNGANVINTYGGDDRGFDRLGNDTVRLGYDDDYVRVGGGIDSFDGGDGKDYISYFDSTGGVTLDLQANMTSGSWVNNDTVMNLKSVAASGAGDDTIRGTDADNDFLYGASGAAISKAGSGMDFLDGDGGDIVKDFENNIDVIELDNFGYLTTAADALAFATNTAGGNVLFDLSATGDGTVLVENTAKALPQNDIDIA